jgi:hypothetical protein
MFEETPQRTTYMDLPGIKTKDNQRALCIDLMALSWQTWAKASH